jgi:hypothetical protein
MSVQIPAGLIASGQGLPSICSRHGRESSRDVRCRFVSRAPRWARLLILLSIWPYIIVVLALRKAVHAPYWPLCPECDRHKRTMLFRGLGLIAVAVVLFVLGIVLMSSTTATVDEYGYPTTEPGPAAGLGGLLIFATVIVFSVGIVVAGLSRVSAVAGGVVSRDGIYVEFRLAHPRFAQHVTEVLKSVRAQPFGYAAEPDYPEPPQPGYPAP